MQKTYNKNNSIINGEIFLLKKSMKKALLFLSLAGVLFSGYMSSVKFFTQTCAFNEPCPLLLGLPACYFGFILFALLALFSGMVFFERIDVFKGLRAVFGVSLAGIIFSGSFSVQELPKLFSQGLRAYALGLPTCTLGLVFFIIIFALCTKHLLFKKDVA